MRYNPHTTPIIPLLLILLLAAAVRMIGIDAESLWIDEGFTYYLTQYDDPLKMLFLDVHPPLYFVLADGWVALTGITELAMRYFSVLPSVLSVAVIYQVARELSRLRGDLRTTAPLLAAFMLALSDPEIFLSQEIRSYTHQVLLILLSMWGMLRWQRTNRRGWLILWVISLSALVYTFYIAAFIGIAQGLYVLIFMRGRQRVIGIIALIIAALSVAPWLLITLGEQSGNLSYANWLRLTPTTIEDIIRRWYTDQWPLTIGLSLLGLVTFIDAPPLKIRWRPIAPAALLLLWLIVPLVLTFIGNTQAPLYQPRRITMITPAVALMIAFGLANLKPPARGFLVAVLLVYGLTSSDFGQFKQPWRDMAQDTAPYIAPDDLLLAELGGDDYAVVYHYDRILPNSVTVRGLTTWRHLQPETYEAGLPALIDSHNPVWLFYWGKDESALAWLDNLNFTRTHEITVEFNPDVYLWRYDRLPSAPIATYENGMTLHTVRPVAENGLVDLIWSTSAPLDRDYVTSVVLLDEAGAVIAQRDSVPAEGARSTLGWTPENAVYDAKFVTTPDGAPIPAGTYTIGVVVYAFDENQQIERILTAAGDDLFTAGTITIPSHDTRH